MDRRRTPRTGGCASVECSFHHCADASRECSYLYRGFEYSLCFFFRREMINMFILTQARGRPLERIKRNKSIQKEFIRRH